MLERKGIIFDKPNFRRIQLFFLFSALVLPVKIANPVYYWLYPKWHHIAYRTKSTIRRIYSRNFKKEMFFLPVRISAILYITSWVAFGKLWLICVYPNLSNSQCGGRAAVCWLNPTEWKERHNLRTAKWAHSNPMFR